jgi:hypothetical protein
MPVQFISITLLNRKSLELINLKFTLFSSPNLAHPMETSK